MKIEEICERIENMFDSRNQNEEMRIDTGFLQLTDEEMRNLSIDEFRLNLSKALVTARKNEEFIRKEKGYASSTVTMNTVLVEKLLTYLDDVHLLMNEAAKIIEEYNAS